MDDGEVVEKVRATSWTGTERLRRDQGTCADIRTKPPVSIPRFAIPTGTRCRVCRVATQVWRPHTTMQPLAFERFETYGDYHYVFRQEGWLIRVERGSVKHREDLPNY